MFFHNPSAHVTLKSWFSINNGFKSELDALNINLKYFMHIFMGFWGPLIFYLQFKATEKKWNILMALKTDSLKLTSFGIKTTLKYSYNNSSDFQDL